MAMSDCIKCFDTPCRCGYDYGHWTDKEIENQIEMFQKLLAARRMAAFRSEGDIDVTLQPNGDMLIYYHDMIMLREKEKLIQFDVAKVHDSGFINAVSNKDGLTKITLVDSGHGYIMSDAAFDKLEVMVGERVAIMLHHKQYRIFKTPARITPIKTKSN